MRSLKLQGIIIDYRQNFPEKQITKYLKCSVGSDANKRDFKLKIMDLSDILYFRKTYLQAGANVVSDRMERPMAPFD